MTAVTFGFPTAGSLGPSHATIGTFDGIHRGHLALLKTLIAGARRTGAGSVVITFEPHPRCVLDPDHCPPNLTTLGAAPAGTREPFLSGGLTTANAVTKSGYTIQLTATPYAGAPSSCNGLSRRSPRGAFHKPTKRT